MNATYRTIRRIMTIAACLPMSISAVSIALINNTNQPLTILPTNGTLQPGQQYGQDIGGQGQYTPILLSSSGHIIGVSMIENAPGTLSTVTIKRTPTGFEEDTIVIDTKEKLGNFAGVWSVREENGSLQLVEVAPPAPSIPIRRGVREVRSVLRPRR